MNAHVDLKIVLLGDNSVGKSCLSERFANDRFTHCPNATIGSAFVSRHLEVSNKKILVGIWDTAGSERYDSMTKLYYRGAQAAIVCYDASSPKTFKKVKFWISELRSVEERCKIYICATKKDLLNNDCKLMQSLENVEKYADGLQSKFYITSSKTGENVGYRD